MFAVVFLIEQTEFGCLDWAKPFHKIQTNSILPIYQVKFGEKRIIYENL
jgi:hypothetical protein